MQSEKAAVYRLEIILSALKMTTLVVNSNASYQMTYSKAVKRYFSFFRTYSKEAILLVLVL